MGMNFRGQLACKQALGIVARRLVDSPEKGYGKFFFWSENRPTGSAFGEQSRASPPKNHPSTLLGSVTYQSAKLLSDREGARGENETSRQNGIFSPIGK